MTGAGALDDEPETRRGRRAQPAATKETQAMIPLFHKHNEDGSQQANEQAHLPSLNELGPQLDDAADRVAAPPLEEFAEQLMTRYFTTDPPRASTTTAVVGLDLISLDLLPDNSGEKMHEPIPDGYFAFQDVVAEALQLLRNAGLIMERSYKVGQDHAYSQWLTGFVTTRRGRSALKDQTVAQILSRTYAPQA
jgi:hypothetical protein